MSSNIMIKDEGFDTTLDRFFNSFFPDMGTTWDYSVPIGQKFNINSPRANTLRTEDGYAIEVALPGVNKNNVDINIDGDIMIVTSNDKGSSHLVEGDYARQEFNYSSFSRKFRLPAGSQSEEITANFNDGILRVSVPNVRTRTAIKREVMID